LTGKGLSNLVWADRVKEELRSLGAGNGFKTAASVPKADFDEWLFDVCWLEYRRRPDGSVGFLRRLALAAECEWGNRGDVEDVFEKLLVSRADLRVVIYEANSSHDVQSIASRLWELEQRFERRNPEDRYLLAGRDSSEHGFTCFQLTSEGIQPYSTS